MLCFGPKITVPIPATSVQVYKLCAQMFPNGLYFINVYLAEYGQNMDSAWALCIQCGEDHDFSKWRACLLLSYTVGQRPQASHETWLAHPEWVEETYSCLLRLNMCQLVPIFRR